MKKLFITITIIIALIIAIATSWVVFIDYNKIYREFTKDIKINIDSVDQSDFKIHTFPMPYLVIDHATEKGKITVKDVEIRFSLMSLLSFNPKISDLRIGEVIVHLDHDDVTFLNHDEFIAELLSKNTIFIKSTINKLTFLESDHDVALTIENVKFVNDGQKTSISGVIDSVGKLESSFVHHTPDAGVLNLLISSKNYDFHLQENYKNHHLVDGSLELNTSILAYKISKMIPDLAEFVDHINSSEVVNIKSKILPTQNGLGLKDIVINSKSIQGTGDVDISKNIDEASNIKLVFDKIDLVSWNKSSDKKQKINNGRYNFYQKFNFNNNKMQADLFIKNIRLDHDNQLDNVDIKTQIKDGKLYIQNCTGTIDQSGSFNLGGIITQNAFRSQFDGKLSFNHKDLNDLAEYFGGVEVRTKKPIPFSFYSEIKLNSVDLSLENLWIKTHDVDLMGSISKKFIGDFPRVNANVKFSSINVDDENFPAISQAFYHTMNLFEGIKQEDYLSKFIPVRKIHAIGNYDITFENFIAGNKTYQNVNFNLATSPGKISIEQLSLKNGEDWVDTSISLEARGVRPILYITIHNASMAVNFLSAPAMLELRNKILEHLDLNKIDIVMDFSIEKLYDDNLVLEKILFQAKNNHNLFNITKFDANLLGGKMYSTGSVLLDPYTINFVYTLNAANIEEIRKLLPDNIITTNGLLSASGMLSTRGDKLNEQLYNLYVRSNIITRDITLNKFSIDDFIQKVAATNYDIPQLNNDVKTALLTGETKITDLETHVELTKGVFDFSSIIFKTKYSSASGKAKFNIYDFNLDLNNDFFFYLSNSQHDRTQNVYEKAAINVKANGGLFLLKKTADSKKLEEKLKERKDDHRKF